MTKEEEFTEIGRMVVELQEIDRHCICLRNRLSRLSRQVSDAVLLLDDHPASNPEDVPEEFSGLFAEVREAVTRRKELKAMLAGLTDTGARS